MLDKLRPRFNKKLEPHKHRAAKSAKAPIVIKAKEPKLTRKERKLYRELEKTCKHIDAANMQLDSRVAS